MDYKVIFYKKKFDLLVKCMYFKIELFIISNIIFICS